ncbi:MAG: hypothetical protein ACI35R_01870 [Bacillus sp. (in: firmicutes)]
MKKKKWLIVPALALTIFLSYTSFYFYKSYTEKEALKSTAQQIVDDYFSEGMISNIESVIDDNLIHISLDVKERFETWKPVEQFGSFYLFNRQLRFMLWNNSPNTNLHGKDIVISATSNGHSFEYTSTLATENLIYSAKSRLTLDQKVIYTSAEFKNFLNDITAYENIEKVNGYDDIEIFNYGRKFFHTLTGGGRHFNPDVDNQLIINAVIDKFGITGKQYRKIYLKYYFLL